MKIVVEINDSELQETVTQVVAKSLFEQYSADRRLIKKAVETAVKEAVYSQKAELIDRCVNQASKELVRKAFPLMSDALQRAMQEQTEG